MDFFLQGGDCPSLLGLDGLLDDLGAEFDGQQLTTSTSISVGARAEHGELEPTGQLFTDPHTAQVAAGAEGGDDHLLADRVLEVVFDIARKSESHLF